VVEDQYIRFERNEAYYRGAPQIEVINLRFPDAATIAAGLETGEIDLTNSVPPEDFVRFIDNPDFKIVSQPGNVFCNVSANNSRIPKPVRQAIGFAIDRQAITDELFLNSQLSVPFYHHLGQQFLQPNPYELDLSYNPDRARELVAEAIASGEWEADRAVDFVFEGEEVGDELLFIAQYLQDIGVNATLRGLGDRAAFNTTVLEEMDYDLVSICNAFGPDPDSVTIYYKSGFSFNDGGFNFTQFSNARADEILEAARTETDSAKRIALYQELQGILDDEQAMIPIRLLRVGWVMRSNVNATPQHFGHLPNYAGIETWTIDG
jgi:peptide/nickel transport system substrate-binding protein